MDSQLFLDGLPRSGMATTEIPMGFPEGKTYSHGFVWELLLLPYSRLITIWHSYVHGLDGYQSTPYQELIDSVCYVFESQIFSRNWGVVHKWPYPQKWGNHQSEGVIGYTVYGQAHILEEASFAQRFKNLRSIRRQVKKQGYVTIDKFLFSWLSTHSMCSGGSGFLPERCVFFSRCFHSPAVNG